jgi:hypothetical protein
LGYPPGGEKPEDTSNHRNGTGTKIVLTDDGPLAIDVPRDREATFDPRLIPKHERRFTCIVHLIRNSLDFDNWKERKPMATALRPIYTAPSAEAASAALDEFERGRGVGSFRRSSRRGAAPGRTSFRSSRSARSPTPHLHHQFARERARPASQDHQNAREFSPR